MDSNAKTLLLHDTQNVSLWTILSFSKNAIQLARWSATCQRAVERNGIWPIAHYPACYRSQTSWRVGRRPAANRSATRFELSRQ